jgi:hypothetical protein
VAAEAENGADAGTSGEEVDVEALFTRLREEVRGGGRAYTTPHAPQVRLSARDQAERLWPVSAERPLVGGSAAKGTVGRPVKLVLRRLMRWYVEPLAADQRSFNDAVLKLIDDLDERLTAIERRLDEK